MFDASDWESDQSDPDIWLRCWIRWSDAEELDNYRLNTNTNEEEDNEEPNNGADMVHIDGDIIFVLVLQCQYQQIRSVLR